MVLRVRARCLSHLNLQATNLAYLLREGELRMIQSSQFGHCGENRNLRRALLLFFLLALLSVGLTAHAAPGPWPGPYVGAKSGPGLESCQACGNEQHLYNPTSSRVEVVVLESRSHPSDSSWNYKRQKTYQLGPNDSLFLGCTQGIPAGTSTCTLVYYWSVKSWKKIK